MHGKYSINESCLLLVSLLLFLDFHIIIINAIIRTLLSRLPSNQTILLWGGKSITQDSQIPVFSTIKSRLLAAQVSPYALCLWLPIIQQRIGQRDIQIDIPSTSCITGQRPPSEADGSNKSPKNIWRFNQNLTRQTSGFHILYFKHNFTLTFHLRSLNKRFNKF